MNTESTQSTQEPITRYDIHPEDRAEPRLKVSDFQWRVAEEPATADNSLDAKPSIAPLTLCATMQIGLASFHVQAFLVEYRAQWSKRGSRLFSRSASDRRRNETIELRRNDEMTSWLWNAHGMEGYCETVKIPGIGKGREYAIFISPFCR